MDRWIDRSALAVRWIDCDSPSLGHMRMQEETKTLLIRSSFLIIRIYNVNSEKVWGGAIFFIVPARDTCWQNRVVQFRDTVTRIRIYGKA